MYRMVDIHNGLAANRWDKKLSNARNPEPVRLSRWLLASLFFIRTEIDI